MADGLRSLISLTHCIIGLSHHCVWYGFEPPSAPLGAHETSQVLLGGVPGFSLFVPPTEWPVSYVRGEMVLKGK